MRIEEVCQAYNMPKDFSRKDVTEGLVFKWKDRDFQTA